EDPPVPNAGVLLLETIPPVPNAGVLLLGTIPPAPNAGVLLLGAIPPAPNAGVLLLGTIPPQVVVPLISPTPIAGAVSMTDDELRLSVLAIAGRPC
ncbi:MAG TPA: hypothetical protein DDZ51_22810, partial [Planctomycetaceae bacterium]|nr:hypothetical protein [Planctomycetaceae bacterium]